jgi:hypothetical protein
LACAAFAMPETSHAQNKLGLLPAVLVWPYFPLYLHCVEAA